jgi:D-glycero-D-manno-heptose 1,7-bisphosphate phosphatase
MKAKTLFLDRDGVLNSLITENDELPRSPRYSHELNFIPGTFAALTRAKVKGYQIYVVTNQPDIEKGLISEEESELINLKVKSTFPQINEIYVCPHTQVSNCLCRKPKPGLILNSDIYPNIDFNHAWMVGDRWVDIAAGASANLKTILIENEFSWKTTTTGIPNFDLKPLYKVSNLEEAVDLI